MSDFDLTTIETRVVDVPSYPDATPSVTRTPSKTKRIAAAAIAALAGVVAAFGTSEPTGGDLFDLGWRILLAVVTTLAASTARRWSLLWMASIAVLVSGSWLSLAFAAAGLVAAGIAALLPRHNRVVGAAAGAFAAQALVRTGDSVIPVVYGIGVAAAVVPLCYSAYRLLRRKHRRQVRRVVILGVAGVTFISVAAAFSAFKARADMNDGVDAMRAGLAAIDEGDDPVASENFAAANRSFTAATDAMSAPWMQVAVAVPVVSQHVEATDAIAQSGVDLSSSAAAVAAGADYRDLRLASGRIDLAALRRIQPTVERAAVAMDASEARIEPIRDEWLVPPLADAVDLLSNEIADVRPETLLAADALDVVPTILGEAGPRRYLVAVTSPNETRNSGGFMGGYAELTVTNGLIEKTASGSISELNSAGDPLGRTLTGSPEFSERYGTYVPARFLQNATASPDLPTTAKVLAELYPQAGGAPLDGVILLDPAGLAALLELSGPVTVEGIDRPITSENVEAFLLKRQYEEFPENADRDEIQTNVATAVFDTLLSTTLPGPKRIGDALSPAVATGHIGFWTFDEKEQQFLSEIGLDSAFAPGDDDFLSVRVANAGPNKLDAYLERSVAYDVVVDPDRGTYTGTVTVTLRNNAPDGLSDYVAATRELREGRPDALPLGTNRLFVTTYSNSTVRSATVDGEPVALGVQDELGTRAHITQVSIPPGGGEATVVLEVEGTLDGDYRLRLSHQPLAQPDVVSVSVRTTDGDELEVPAEAADVSVARRDIVVPLG